ncbi:MAG: TonB-dependent receptor [Acidobacteriia bacterium]|nr:TonB-dependent receptor [Terriglobia bacterium]
MVPSFVVPAFAQSPNTAALVVTVADQTGAMVSGAQVSIVNASTGTTREGLSGADGSLTLPALPVGGAYTITVVKPGFTPTVMTDIALRAGETASLHVTLVASGGISEVTVYGTTEGVRTDPELGTRIDAERIDETPLLGRKISSVPLLNAAFRNAKGTGDIFMNSVYVVTGAGGRREADFIVDGASGDEPWGRQTMFSTIPVGAVQEMNIMSRAFSAEFGWTASAGINIVTKSGSNDTHGEALFLGRPGGLQSTTFSADQQCPGSISTCVVPAVSGNAVVLVPPDIPDSLAQGSFALGGALVKDQTHYFVAADYTHQDRTAAVTSPLVAAGTTAVGNYRQALVNGRLDHKVDPANSLLLRFNLDRFYDTNPQDAVSGNVLPSAGRQFTRHAWTAQMNHTAVISSNMLNEARFEFQNADPVTAFDPLTPSAQFTRAGSLPFTSGESRFAHVFSRVAQFSDTLSLTKGRHYVRLGGSVAQNTSGGDGTEFGSAFVLGQYTLNATSTRTIEQLTLADVQRYQQSFNFGAGTYELGQKIFNVFAQDSIRARGDLTIDLGLRYDRQTFSDGTNNVAPRIGFGWNPAGNPKTSVRGGYGLYYTMLRANNDASFELSGPQGIFTYAATPGQTGFPSCLTCTPVTFDQNAAKSALPARNITIRPGMASFYSQFFDVSKLAGYGGATWVNPKSQVASIGIEREFAPRLFVSVDYVKQHWTDLDRSVDVNAPSLFARTAPGQVRSTIAADATRPIVPVNGGFRSINVLENLGVADYDGLQTMVRWQNERNVVSVSYTLSSATNTTEPNGNGAAQQDFNQLGEEERGPSLLDQRHRAVIFLSRRLPYDVTIGTVTSLASAKPFNPTTGVDNNGDGNNNDRPIINGVAAGRYSFRGTPLYDAALFAEYKLGLTEGRAVTLRAEGFNVFNRANILARNGTYGDTATPLATFGQATPGLAATDPGRMVQVQVRFAF